MTQGTPPNRTPPGTPASDNSVTFTPGGSAAPSPAAIPTIPATPSAPSAPPAPTGQAARPTLVPAAAPQPAAGPAKPSGGASAAAAPSGPPTTPASGDAPGRAPIDAGHTEEGLGTAATASPAPALLGDQTIGVTDVSQRHLTPTPPGATGAPAGPAAGGASALVGAASPGSAAMTGAVAAADATAAARAQPAPLTAAPADQPATATPPPADAGARAAALIRDQMPILVARIMYDTQELVRVGAVGPDVVTIQQVLESLAAALERGDPDTFGYSYSRAARPNSPQINDQTLPYHLGLQISGMFEAILRDTFNQGFAGDPALRGASVALLAQMSGPAKRALLGEPRTLVQWQAPLI